MVLQRIVHRSTDHGLPRALRAVAVSLVLAVIAYGIVRPPEPEVPAASGVALAVATHATSTPGFDHGSTYPASAALQSRLAPLDPTHMRVDDPRECAPEAGVTDVCIFN